MRDVTIVMVAHNNIEQTKKTIESLHKWTDSSKYKLLFMDNSGTDHTDSWLIWYCQEKGIELKYQYISENIGWVKAVNKAYDMCDTEYVLTCHNDIIFFKQWLERMMRRFKDNVAAVGPVISFAMGPQSVNYAYYTFGCDLKYLLGLFFLCRIDVLREVKKKFYDDKEYLSNAYGLGDKEELELCYRIRCLGYRFEVARDVYIEHTGEKTFVDILGSQQAFYTYQEKQLQVLRSRLGDHIVDDIYKIEIKSPVKLMVGILTRTEYVHYRNVISLLKVWGFTQVCKTFYHVAKGHPASARNTIVKEFLKTDCTHLLFIDDDMIFEEEAIVKLLSMDVDVATGIAYQRGEPYAPCIFLFNPDDKCFYPAEVISDKEKRGQVQVDAVGGYFLLIKRRVLEKVEKPWFVYGDTSLGFNDSEDPDNRGIGEDVYFSAKSRLAGFEIWCDTDLDITHIGREQEINTKFYEEYKASGKMEEALKSMGKFKTM